VASSEESEQVEDGRRYVFSHEYHFDSNVKRMTVVYQDTQRQLNVAFMKGAPERVLDACTYDLSGNELNPKRKAHVLCTMDYFANEGLVITCETYLTSACSGTCIQGSYGGEFTSRSN
jgi:magnesium-transporting ATPase (P-type)